jgi:hypothetical protein
VHTHRKVIFILFTISGLFTEPLWAAHENGHDFSDKEWSSINSKLELLDKLNYLPTLLPTIMRHRDALELTNQQIKALRHWRKQNYENMVGVMNAIIEKRIDFKKAAFNTETTENDLRKMQNDILALQKKLLDIKLTCRRLIMDTFTEQQWDNFAFVIADDPALASFIQQ